MAEGSVEAVGGIVPLFARLRDMTWLSGKRLRAWGVILLVLEIALILFIAAGQWGLIVPLDGPPIPTSFSSFYSAGVLADGANPALVYDIDAHKAVQQVMYGDPKVNYNFYFYPPFLLLLCAPLAALPYLPAFYLWAVGQAVAYIAAVRSVVGRGASLIPYLAFAAAPLSFAMGQNALLTAALFAGGTALLGKGRPFLGGLVLGCLIYKPHFGILLPFALIAGREWKALLGAATAVIALAALSTLAFGWQIWPAFLSLADSGVRGTFESGRVAFDAIVSPFGSVMLAGGGKTAAYAVQGVFAAGSLAAVVWTWRRTGDTPLRAVVLISGTMLSIPVILFYDFLPAAVCAAWLSVAARRTGWLPWEKAALSAIWAVALFGRSWAMIAHVPYGPVVAALTMGMGLRRVRRMIESP